MGPREVHDDRFPDAADTLDSGASQRGGDFVFWGLEGQGLAARPDTQDALAGHAGVHAVGYGFDFGELRHGD
jgi:hypothetical protein